MVAGASPHGGGIVHVLLFPPGVADDHSVARETHDGPRNVLKAAAAPIKTLVTQRGRIWGDRK